MTSNTLQAQETRQGTTLHEAVENFLLSRRVAGVATTTLDGYVYWLQEFAEFVGSDTAPTVLDVTRFLAHLQEKKLAPASRKKALQVLKAFCRWAVRNGLLAQDPTKDVTVKAPLELPTVPTDEELRAVIDACGANFVGRRNRALILVLADAGLRASEALHLLVESWNPQDRSLLVRHGKGAKDRTVFVGPTTARAIKEYLAVHPALSRENFLFVDEKGRPLKRRHLIAILHRLSKRAGLPRERRLHPHSLRHYAATSWLRNGMGLEEVRRLLGHSTLAMTLRYSNLVGADLQAAHKRASALERIFLKG
jgi:site-specific recombinase XerD